MSSHEIPKKVLKKLKKKKFGRLCARDCVKDGPVHDFKGHVKLLLVDAPEQENKWRALGAAFIHFANVLMSANFAIIIIYTFSYRETFYFSAHCLLCTIGLQMCIPLSILVLHTMYGQAAVSKRKQRRMDHVLFSLMGMFCAGVGSGVALLDYRKCLPMIHIVGACVTTVAMVLSIITGLFVWCRKKEAERPSCFSSHHRFWGMIALLASSFTYLTAIGGCRATMQLWLYSLGNEAPLYMIYFIVVLYTLIVLYIPGTKFIIRTKYN